MVDRESQMETHEPRVKESFLDLRQSVRTFNTAQKGVQGGCFDYENYIPKKFSDRRT